ncbi:protein GVQW3-like [Daktulosphaira vitifoliae]|uniref:protein GVQW3-like n=1 Tax=Daktulosphaira vitifoliae TaxID=58002 RepID=UPI0021AAA596|nr:protein GVQW3-like [Daktulosphaira vitifoliae]
MTKRLSKSTINIDERVNIKFLVKLKKTAVESFCILCEVYGEECLSRARSFKWHKRFCNGGEDVEDDDRSGCPTTCSSNENVVKIDKIIRQDRRLSVRAVVEIVNIDRESVHKILVENFNIKKVCAKMVPKNLMIDQKFNRKEICSDTLKIINDNPSFINNIITCDETWIFTYDLETKRQSIHWKTPTSPRMKKARMSKLKFKAMLIVFFDIKGIIFVEWVLSG